MELIKKINEFVKTICDEERIKTTEFSDGKFLVASSVFEIIKQHKSSPPKLRPVSEAKAGYDYLFLLQSRRSPDIYHWRTLYAMNEFRLFGLGGEDYDFNRANLEANKTFKLIGWQSLPPIDKMQLPDPNEM